MQIPSVPDANVHTMKVVRRKKLILERLLFAPVDAVSGDSGSGSAASLLCGQPANAPSKYDFWVSLKDSLFPLEQTHKLGGCELIYNVTDTKVQLKAASKTRISASLFIHFSKLRFFKWSLEY